jgi:hypothetical protein
MTKPLIRLQDLRRRIYAKAKSEPSWRFWGLRPRARDSEERAHERYVHHPDVIDEASDDGVRDARLDRRCRNARPALSSDPGDRAGRGLPGGTGEGLSHLLVASEAEGEHGLERAANDVVETSDRRRRLHGPADGLGERVGVLLPVQDGVSADAEGAGGLVRGPSQQALDLEDLEALLGVVEGTAPLVELVEAGGHDLGRAGPQEGLELGLACLGEGNSERVVGRSKPAQQDARSEAEEMGGGEGGAEGELLGRAVDGAK